MNPPPVSQTSTYNHAYHQSLVYKVFLARKSDPVHLVTTLEQTLDAIRHFARISRGMPQIVYLVGWQHDGHDSKYPDWSAINPRLRRPGDRDSRQSVLWLMEAGRRYGATVSVHINMCDAYENSPLWLEYLKEDLLVRNADGSLKKGYLWGGEQSYLVCKTREWNSGRARRRIDALLNLLPLEKAGTVHIDVFQPMPSPYHEIGVEEEIKTMKQIIAYWRSRGIDVTKEWWHHELAGLVPMVLHLNLDEAGRLQYPPWVGCGGGSAWNMRQADRGQKPGGFSVMPEAGCLYEEAWGQSVSGDVMGTDLEEMTGQFFLKTLPWYFLNRHRALRHTQTASEYTVEFSDDITSTVRTEDRHLTIRQKERLLVDGTDLFIPALWRDKPEWIAYSQEGCDKEWRLPENWGNPAKVKAEWLSGPEASPRVQLSINRGKLRLKVAPRQAFVIYPDRA